MRSFSSIKVRVFALVAASAMAVSVVAGVSAASAAPPPGVSMKGTGPQPSGLGLFSKAALAQEHCSADGRMWFSTEGTGPYCVNPWPKGKDNGGSTAPGVTATEVKVVVYSPQATADQFLQTIKDTQAVYQYASDTYGTYQLWGRKPVISMVGASGTDEAAQRADALKVIAMKPFMVIDVLSSSLGAPVFSAELAKAKILVASSSTTPEEGAQQSPYRWNYGTDQTATVPLDRGVRRALARWGEGELRGRQIDDVEEAVVRGHLRTGQDRLRHLREAAETERCNADQGGGVQLARSHDRQGVVAHTGVAAQGCRGHERDRAGRPGTFAPMLDIASTQDYSPEWIMTGFGYTDFDPYARTLRPGADEARVRHRLAHALQHSRGRWRHREVALTVRLVLG